MYPDRCTWSMLSSIASRTICSVRLEFAPASGNIVRSPLTFPAKPVVSEAMQDLITQLLVKDPRERLALNEVEAHPWIVAHADPAVLNNAGGKSS